MQVKKGDFRIRQVLERLAKSEAVTSDERKERHGRNVQLSTQGISVSGNKLINSILDQVYAKGDDSGDNVQ